MAEGENLEAAANDRRGYSIGEEDARAERNAMGVQADSDGNELLARSLRAHCEVPNAVDRGFESVVNELSD